MGITLARPPLMALSVRHAYPCPEPIPFSLKTQIRRHAQIPHGSQMQPRNSLEIHRKIGVLFIDFHMETQSNTPARRVYKLG